MKIKITKITGREWEADCTDLPGMPPLGQGRSKGEALGNLILKVLGDVESWKEYIPKFEITFACTKKDYCKQLLRALPSRYPCVATAEEKAFLKDGTATSALLRKVAITLGLNPPKFLEDLDGP